MQLMPKLEPVSTKASLAEFNLNPIGVAGTLAAGEWPSTFSTGCCPECGDDFAVVNSRRNTAHGPDMVRRRRACVACGYKATTVEMNVIAVDLLMKGVKARNAISDALRSLADQIDASSASGEA